MTAKSEDDRSGLLGRLMSLGARPANPPPTPNGQAHRAQRDNGAVPPHRKNRKPYTVWYDVGTIKQLKQLALDTGMTQQDLMVMAANDLFKKYDKPPIAI
jgi:Antitoxin-like ribbon-helix-helix